MWFKIQPTPAMASTSYKEMMLKVGPNSSFISKPSQRGKGTANFTSLLAWDPKGKHFGTDWFGWVYRSLSNSVPQRKVSLISLPQFVSISSYLKWGNKEYHLPSKGQCEDWMRHGRQALSTSNHHLWKICCCTSQVPTLGLDACMDLKLKVHKKTVWGSQTGTHTKGTEVCTRTKNCAWKSEGGKTVLCTGKSSEFKTSKERTLSTFHTQNSEKPRKRQTGRLLNRLITD